MKIRIFQNMCDSVFRIVINTDDWSQDDIKLMLQYGEPEVDVGGSIEYEYNGESKTKVFGSRFVRILHGFPYSSGFDSRDFGSDEEAVEAGRAWKDEVVNRIKGEVSSLRENSRILPTEEIEEI